MKTVVKVDNQKHQGRLHLDSQELSFSSPTLKWSHKVGSNISLKQAGGQLKIDGPKGIVTIEIGRDIDRWVDKILNPPSRLTKLGFKDRDCLWMSRGFSKEFREELKLAKITTTRSLERCSAAMHMVKNEDQLAAAAELLQGLPVGVNAWLVWPKGDTVLSRDRIIRFAKDLGFGPSKTAAFDEGLSSMRFARKKS